MWVPVLVEGWQIECCMDPPSVGDRVQWHLVFTEPDEKPDPERMVDLDVVAWLMGEATHLNPSGGRRHGVWLGVPDRVAGLSLYWSAPRPVQGRTRISGYVHEDHHGGVPEGFPEARGVIRRIRVETRWMVEAEPGVWVPTGEPSSYADVETAPKTFESRLVPGEISMTQPGILVDLEVDEHRVA